MSYSLTFVQPLRHACNTGFRPSKLPYSTEDKKRLSSSSAVLVKMWRLSLSGYHTGPYIVVQISTLFRLFPLSSDLGHLHDMTYDSGAKFLVILPILTSNSLVGSCDCVSCCMRSGFEDAI